MIGRQKHKDKDCVLKIQPKTAGYRQKNSTDISSQAYSTNFRCFEMNLTLQCKCASKQTNALDEPS